MYYKLAKVYSLDKQGIVVLDSTNAKTEFRVDKVLPLKKSFNEVDLVVFKLDKITVMEQNLDRKYPIPSDALEKLIDNFEDIGEREKEFFDNIYIVDKHDLTPIIEQILK